MPIDRRNLLALSVVTASAPAAAMAMAAPAIAAPLASLGVDARSLGVRAGGGADQTNMLQSAIDQTAGARVPLVLGPGEYRTGELKLPTGTQLVGVRGATRLVFTGGGAVISARGANHITLSGLVIDGGNKPLPNNGGLVNIAQGRSVRIIDCEILNSGGNGIVLDAIEGSVSGTEIFNSAEGAIFSRDARGLSIQNNTIRGAGNNGILVWSSAKTDDGTLVINLAVVVFLKVAGAPHSVGFRQD